LSRKYSRRKQGVWPRQMDRRVLSFTAAAARPHGDGFAATRSCKGAAHVRRLR
jgi:hypothetical protein